MKHLIGTRVGFVTHPPSLSGPRGEIVEPTAEELTYARKRRLRLAGLALVQWGGERWDRSWVRHDDLRVLDARETDVNA